MINADVIMPITGPTNITHLISNVGIRTCAASTSARILVLDNNTPEGERRDNNRRVCEGLELDYHYIDGPFSLSRFFNLGASMTKGDYIAYSSCDMIFFPGWFENIIDLWNDNPDYFLLTTYTYDNTGSLPCSQNRITNERRIVDAHNPASGVCVIKRSSGYVWDEQFSLWELDADILYFIERNSLKSGYCLNARADHLISSIKDNIDLSKHYGFSGDIHTNFYGLATDRLRKKWNLT